MEKWGIRFGKVVPKVKPKDVLKTWNIVAGDIVQVISGGCKGQQGKVIHVRRRENRVRIEGINIVRGGRPVPAAPNAACGGGRRASTFPTQSRRQARQSTTLSRAFTFRMWPSSIRSQSRPRHRSSSAHICGARTLTRITRCRLPTRIALGYGEENTGRGRLRISKRSGAEIPKPQIAVRERKGRPAPGVAGARLTRRTALH